MLLTPHARLVRRSFLEVVKYFFIIEMIRICSTSTLFNWDTEEQDGGKGMLDSVDALITAKVKERGNNPLCLCMAK